MNEELSPIQNDKAKRRSIWIRTLRPMLPFIAVVLSAFLAVALYSLLFPAPVPPGQSEIDESVRHAIASMTPPPYSAQVYQAILPSLVFSQTERENV
jgi:hypothetical protein